MDILGVRIDKLKKRDALNKVSFFLNTPGQYKIFTPNPEMIVKASKDGYFREVLNSGDLNLCDGFGLWLFAPGAERIPGIDFIQDICRIAEKEGSGIYLLGSDSNDTVSAAAEKLQSYYTFLAVAGWGRGPVIDEDKFPLHKRRPSSGVGTEEDRAVISKINDSGARILFVAFGMGKQEKWITENLPEMPNIKIAMGVGGAFDILSGRLKRAPCWMRRVGVEWVYRLWQEPKRFTRIFNATIKFLFLLFIDKYGKRGG